MATNSEGKICAEISRICGDSHAYFECEVDPATNAVVWRLDLYGKARGYQRLAFATHAEAVAELKKFETEIEDAKTKARTILELERVPDDGWYHLEHECFRDRFGTLWRNAGRIGARPLCLYYCEPSGEPSGRIGREIERVFVNGVEATFIRREDMDY